MFGVSWLPSTAVVLNIILENNSHFLDLSQPLHHSKVLFWGVFSASKQPLVPKTQLRLKEGANYKCEKRSA